MSKFFKATTLVLLCIVTLSFLSACELEKEYTCGDFLYSFVGRDHQYIKITGLTEQGMDKSVLAIPAEIDGITVSHVWKAGIGNYGNSIWQSPKLKKLYLPDCIVNFDQMTLSECAALEYVIILPIADYNEEFNEFLPSVGNDHNIYVFSNIYFERYEDNWSNLIFPANVTYYYNFERPDNGGVFWLDVVEQGEKIVDVPPSDPVRDRYTFGGWYTEPECINEWDFATDTMPHPENSEEFYELELYAKWI